MSYTLAHGVAAADEAMAELQKNYWQSDDLKRGLASLAVDGPGAARFEGR